MSRSIHDLSAAVASLGDVIGRAVTSLQAEAQIEESVAKLNSLANGLKAALAFGPVGATLNSSATTASEAPAAGSAADASSPHWRVAQSQPVSTDAEHVLMRSMSTSENGRDFIQAFEGKFLKAYDDGTGVLTIGYGHTTDAGPPVVDRGLVITDEECDDIFARDLAVAERSVAHCITCPMAQYEFDALVSFEFNTGALSKSPISDEINTGDIHAAMATLLRYDHAGGHQIHGLTRRRQAERLMFLGDVGQAMFVAGAHMIAPGGPMPQDVEAAAISLSTPAVASPALESVMSE